MEFDLEIIKIKIDIDNGLKTKNLMALLSEQLLNINDPEICFDFEKVRFIAANQLAIFGALFDSFCADKDTSIYIANLRIRLKTVMQKNGFGKRLGYEPLLDKFNTTIPYMEFGINDSFEFEKYLIMHIFQRTDIPFLSENAKNTIIDNILEVFNNVKEHTSSSTVYACGQFFPKSEKLYFTIVDIGETIKENVINYFELTDKNIEEELEGCSCIEWAIKEGNSTRKEDSPGGLGFSVLSQFIELNKGELSILSDDECYEWLNGKYRTTNVKHKFRGTVVTVAINMSDSFSYLSIDDKIEQIIF